MFLYLTLKKEREKRENWASRAAARRRNKRSVVGVTWLLWWMGSPAALPLLTLGLKSSLEPSTHNRITSTLLLSCFPACVVCLCCVSSPQNAGSTLSRELSSGSWLRLIFNLTTLGRSKWQLGCKRRAPQLRGSLFIFSLSTTSTNKQTSLLLRVFRETSSESHKGFFIWTFGMCFPDLQEHIAEK